MGFHSNKKLIAHMKSHIKEMEIVCPFQGCDSKFDKKGSFASHVSRYHRDVSYATSNKCSPAGTQLENSESKPRNPSLPLDETLRTSNEISDLFVRHNALFYLKLSSKFFLPSSTIDAIISEFQNITQLNKACLKSRLQVLLEKKNLESNFVETLLHELDNDLLDVTFSKGGVLGSQYLLKEYCRKNFAFIAPIAITLGISENCHTHHYHYVHIQESLTVLLKDKSVQRDIACQSELQDDVYTDLKDGSVFKEKFGDPRLITVMLYQDAFEIANPLGSARNKYKILGVYFTLGNLSAKHRSRVDQMQLVLLAMEKDVKKFGIEKVFERVIQDLIKLEISGIEVDAVKYDVRVAVIIGDNLGSHSIGGFLENFSATEYFCRYCEISRTEFQAGQVMPKFHQLRTSESYAGNVEELKRNETLRSVKGVKRDSSFNKLTDFHVCNPGLPPCLGHDLFEGVVNYDLALYIKYFVKTKGWLTYEELNLLINNFAYKGPDAKSKPNGIVSESKLGGSGAQNWCLLRNLPLIMWDKIRDSEDAVWTQVLRLRSFVQSVTAKKYTEGLVANVLVDVEEYIEGRKQLFPQDALKPKHHYICHYPHLILQLGPLIHLWSFRFESKHQFFKRAIRYSQNFINVTAMLAEKHQYFQAYNVVSELFDDKVTFGGRSIVPSSPSLMHAINECTAHKDCDTKIVSEVTVNGSTYTCDNVVIMKDTHSLNVLQIGVIVCVLVDDDRIVHFVVTIHDAFLLPQLGVYEVDSQNDQVHCIALEDLADHMPLQLHSKRGKNYVVLKHQPLHS